MKNQEVNNNAATTNTNVNEQKEEVTMKINEMSQIAQILDAKLPSNVVESVTAAFELNELGKIVKERDIFSLMKIRGVAEKRASAILEALKDCVFEDEAVEEEIHIDETMREIHEVSLTYSDEEKRIRFKKPEKPNMKRFGPALQHLAKMNGTYEKIVFTTISQIDSNDKNPVAIEAKTAAWNQFTHQGMKMHGENWVPALMGTNDKMKCKLHWIRADQVEELHTWTDCGANMTVPQNLAKAAAYRGLLLPYTKQLLNGKLTPDMEVIIPSWENEHNGENVFIEPDGTMSTQQTYTVNEFDGMAILELTPELIQEMNLSRQERRNLMRSIARFNGGTLRAPWQKGCIVTGFHIHEALRRLGVETIQGKPIEKIAIFGDKTVFKAALGESGLYKKFEDYSKNFKEMGHRFGVLLENHGIKKSYLPAQQLQAANDAEEEHLQRGAQEEVAYLNAAIDPAQAALRYCPKPIAQIAQVDPSIMSAWFAKNIANTQYKKEREAALSGRTHGNSVVGFCIKDPVAFAEWIAYCEGVRKTLPQGFLRECQVFAPMAGFTGKAVISRNPVIANYGLKSVLVMKNAGLAQSLFDENFPFIVVGVHDDLCKLLRMDHDGDKARLTYAPWFVDAVESMRSAGRSNGVFAEWESFGKVEKKPATEENMRDFYSTCTASSLLGLNVDTAGVLISNGLIRSTLDNVVIDYVMNKGTDVKQGADGANIPGQVGELYSFMQKARKNCVYSLAQAAGKGLKGRQVKRDSVAKEYGNSSLDVVAKNVSASTVESLPFNQKFDYRVILIGSPKTIKGLCGQGSKDEDDSGFFNKLVRRSKDAWDAIQSEDKDAKVEAFAFWAEYKRWQKQQALKELAEFAEANNATLEDVYDAISTYIFTSLARSYMKQGVTEKSQNWYVVIAKTYLDWFGDMMTKAFQKNKELNNLTSVEEPYELDDEDDPFAEA